MTEGIEGKQDPQLARTNTYSPTWFDSFLPGAGPSNTGYEVEFLARNLPFPSYERMLDLCCGTGRHSLALAELGYKMTGLDLNPYALASARKGDVGGKIEFVQGDMRDLSLLRGQFDAVLNLWQSFGYFNAEENKEVLRQIYAKLRHGGRFVLDIYNRAFFEANQGTRTLESGGLRIVETKHMTGDRLTVHLDYGSPVSADKFDWQLFTPQDIASIASDTGFHTVVVCAGFDESKPPTATNPRMQLVLEKG